MADELPFRLKWLTLFRALVATGLLVLLVARVWSDNREPTSIENFSFALAAAAYLATLLNGLALRSGSVGPFAAWAQVGFDVVLAFSLVFVTGGTESPFAVVFSLATIGSAFLLRWRGAIVGALSSAIAWVLVVVLLSRGSVSTRVLAELATQLVAVGLVAGLAFAITETLSGARGKLLATEADVRRLEAQRQLIVTAMPSGLVTCNAQGVVQFMNPAGEQILGVPADDWVEQQLDRYLPGSSKRRHGRRGEQTVETPDGQRILGLTVTSLGPSEPDSLLVVFQDLSAVRSLERELQAIDKLASLGRLSAQLAHEVRNPLASMRGAAQLLESDLANGQQRMAKLIVRECDRLAELVEGYLRVARPPQPTLRRGRLDLVVAEALELMRTDPLLRMAQLEELLQPAECNFDSDQVKQVLINLIRNAAQAVDVNGVVRVSVSSEPVPSIVVWDSAGSISPEALGRLFEPFFTTRSTGTGLGLSMAMGIIRAHGGTIEADSSRDRGTTFSVRFPSPVGV